MKTNWKHQTKLATTWIFEHTLFPVFRRFVQLYQLTFARQMWGDLVLNNSIHPSAICVGRNNLAVNQSVSIGANCRLVSGEKGHIALDYVYLEPNVTIVTNSGLIEVGFESYINTGSFLWTETGKISIGRQVLIGPSCVLSASNHGVQYSEVPMKHQAYTSVGITVGDNVWIGAGAIICDGVTIGSDTIIAAGAVVTKDVPARVLAGGVPCRVIKSRVPDEVTSNTA